MQQSNLHGKTNPLPTQGEEDDHEISDITLSPSKKRQRPIQVLPAREPSPLIMQQKEPQPFMPRCSI